MKDFNQLIKRIENLGEERTYTEAERKRLQNVFKDGKLSKSICWAGWVEYTDNKGKTHYTKYFSNEVENLMEQLCNERIANVEQSLKVLYEDFTLEKCAQYINEYIKEISNMEAKSVEWQRLKKNAYQSCASVENGKLNKENGNNYDCIVIRHRNFYAGSMIINKTENGYKIEERVPLCGECNYQTDIYGLFKCLKQFTRNAIY